MSDLTSRADPASGFGYANFTLTLQPFTAGRQAALAPDPALGIVKATPIKICQRWHNALNEVIIRQADDLFACAAQDGSVYDLAPKGGELTELTLEIHFADCPEPHLVNLKPPRGLILQHPEDLERVLSFLKRRGFLVENSQF